MGDSDKFTFYDLAPTQESFRDAVLAGLGVLEGVGVVEAAAALDHSCCDVANVDQRVDARRTPVLAGLDRSARRSHTAQPAAS